MIQVAEYQSADEMRTSYSAIRARLNGIRRIVPRPIVRPPEPVYEPIARKDIKLVRTFPKVVDGKKVRDILDLGSSPLETPAAVLKAEWKRIVMEVAAEHDVTVMDVIGQTRSAPVTRARQQAYYRLRTETPLSFPEIGRRLGGRDHTTVLYGYRKHKQRMEAGLV